MAILKCRDLVKSYGRKTALRDVNFAIEPGRIVGLLGPNGSGKTTLIKIATGLLTATSGSIKIDDMSPGKETKAIVSYLPEATYLNDWMKVSQLVNFFDDFYADFDREKANEMLRNLNIDDKESLKSLSKGTKEKVQLILVMARNAKLYLLDEPIGGVDPASRDYILNTIIKNYNPEASVVISTHLISDIEQVLDDVVFLKDGQIVLSTTVDDLRETHGMSVDGYFREVFKC
ncbi:MAG: ABC transporter ATP-binding protein [Oscillospiraceae bacterium]|nr:ABC transporter ATP-binding protein [Oscillospiraceae bacterium]